MSVDQLLFIHTLSYIYWFWIIEIPKIDKDYFLSSWPELFLEGFKYSTGNFNDQIINGIIKLSELTLYPICR